MSYNNGVPQMLILITQLGLSMLTPIFLCTFLGSFLQNRYEIPVFVPLLILGILAGGRNTYKLAKSAIDDGGDKKDVS